MPLGEAAHDPGFRSLTSPQALAAAIYSPFRGDAIRAGVYPTFNYSSVLGLNLIVQVWVDLSGLTFTHQLDGIHRASAQVAISVLGNTGTPVVDTTYDLDLQLTGEDYQKGLRQGWVGQAELRIPAAGAYLVRAAVLDGASSRMGSASRLVDVPAVAGGQMTLSGIAIHGKNPAAHRVFAPGSVVNFEYQILNPVTAQGKPADLETLVHLYRGTAAVFTGEPQPLPAKNLENPKIRLISGRTDPGTQTAGRALLAAGHGVRQGNAKTAPCTAVGRFRSASVGRARPAQFRIFCKLHDESDSPPGFRTGGVCPGEVRILAGRGLRPRRADAAESAGVRFRRPHQQPRQHRALSQCAGGGGTESRSKCSSTARPGRAAS